MIVKVWDDFLGFIALESNLFVSTGMNRAFLRYSLPGLAEEKVRASLDETVDKLFCALVSYDVIPTICAPKNGPSEFVASKLAKKMHDVLANDPEFFARLSASSKSSISDSRQRPVLLILDRGMDLATPLKHSISYQCLVDDVLDYSLNVATDSKSGKKHPLDPENDSFWVSHAELPFHRAIEDHTMEIQTVTDKIGA